MCLGILPAGMFSLAASEGNIDVTFVVDGKVVATKEVPYGWYFSESEVPAEATAAALAEEKENYWFYGWYNANGRDYNYYYYEDTVFYASYAWESTLTFLSADGEKLGTMPVQSKGRFRI